MRSDFAGARAPARCVVHRCGVQAPANSGPGKFGKFRTLNNLRYVLPPIGEDIPPLPEAVASLKAALAKARAAEDHLRAVLEDGNWLAEV